MEYICPYCGKKVYESELCTFCNNDLHWVKRLNARGAFYYAKGYREAEMRNLSGAIVYLKKAISLNKYDVKARNLLGLIYFEMGQIGGALKEWIISSAVDKEDEMAVEYIQFVQKSPKLLVNYKEANHLYNLAIDYLRQGSSDMAIIRLKKATGLSPSFVEAKVLLGLCYMQDKQFYKSKEQIVAALQIDQGHEKALRYFRALDDKDTNTAWPYEIGLNEKEIAYQLVNPIKVIDRSKTLIKYAMYFVVGAMCVLIIEKSLIIPTQVRNYEKRIQMLESNEEVLNEQVDALKKEANVAINSLKENEEKLSREKNEYEKMVQKATQKEKLEECEALKEQGAYVEVAAILYNIVPDALEEDAAKIYEDLKETTYERAANILCNEGYNHLNNEEFSEAKTKLETVLLYTPSDELIKRSLYYLGKTESGLGNEEKAGYYFNKVIEDYPYTNESNWAQSRLDELN